MTKTVTNVYHQLLKVTVMNGIQIALNAIILQVHVCSV